MDAERIGAPARQEQHVPPTEKALGAVHVEDRPRVHLARDLEGDARGEVRFDHAGDHVDGRPLRRDDEMDADGARHLREARDGVFDLAARDEHEIRELVDHHDDVRQRLGTFVLSEAPVVAVDVARAARREQPVAVLHLLHEPEERLRRFLLDLGHHRHQEVRDARVSRQFQHLRIDEHEPEFVRPAAQEETGEHGVDARALPRTRRAGDQEVRHLREVRRDGSSGGVVSERQRERGGRRRELL